MNIRSIAEKAAHGLGAGAVLRAVAPKGVRILMYHRFPGGGARVRKQLSRQCAHLRKHYRPVGLAEIAQAWAEGRELPRRSLAITVDDGYADFADAFAVFHEFELPVTLFVVSGFLERTLWLWPDVLRHCLKQTRFPQVVFGERVYPLGGAEARKTAFDSIAEVLIASPEQARVDGLAGLRSQLEVEFPREIPERFAPLSWEQLTRMAERGLDVGAHTRTHPLVSRVGAEQLHAEIAGSRADIERETGHPVRHFCYPNGKRADYSPAAVEEVRRAGYQAAVVAEAGLAAPSHGIFELPRIGVEPDFPELYFERCVSAFRLGG